MMKYSQPKVTDIMGRDKQGACFSGSSATGSGCTAGPDVTSQGTCGGGGGPGTGNCYDGSNAASDGGGQYCQAGTGANISGFRCVTGGVPAVP